MLEHVEQRNEVITVALEHREVGQPGALHLARQALARDGPGAAVKLARLEASKLLQHRKIVSRAAPDLEDLGLLRRPHDALDQALQDAPARQEPPMVLIQLGHAVENGAFHPLDVR